MCGDDEAVRNGADDSERETVLELFRQLVAMPPKKCVRAACRSKSLCGVATSRLPEQKLERSRTADVIGAMELMPRRTARSVKRKSFIVYRGNASRELSADERETSNQCSQWKYYCRLSSCGERNERIAAQVSWSIGRFRSGLPKEFAPKR